MVFSFMIYFIYVEGILVDRDSYLVHMICLVHHHIYSSINSLDAHHQDETLDFLNKLVIQHSKLTCDTMTRESTKQDRFKPDENRSVISSQSF